MRNLWLLYFGLQLVSFIVSSGIKAWQVIKGRHKRYSGWLKLEELVGSLLSACALVGLWGYIQATAYLTREFWAAVFWGLLAMIVIQPLLPKSRLLNNTGGRRASLAIWLGACMWAMPLIWALWAYKHHASGLWA